MSATPTRKEQTQYGLSAVRQLRADQKAWAGPLDEAQLRRAIQANLDVRTSPDAQSEDVVRQDMAFHRQQAFEAIRDLLNSAYSEDFQAFDYFTADTLTPEDAPDFYANRVHLLQQWLEDNAFAFSQAERELPGPAVPGAGDPHVRGLHHRLAAVL